MVQEKLPGVDQHTLLERISALTDEIHHATQMSNWREAALLTEVRSPLLMSLRAEQTLACLAIINRIRAIDAQILAEAHGTREAMQAEFATTMKQIRAVNQYQRVALL